MKVGDMVRLASHVNRVSKDAIGIIVDVRVTKATKRSHRGKDTLYCDVHWNCPGTRQMWLCKDELSGVLE